jgi:hypothetical protein
MNHRMTHHLAHRICHAALPLPLMSLLFLSFTLIISSCDSEENSVSSCRPTNLKTYYDSTVFEYDAEKKITAILHYVYQSQIVRRDEFEYNDKGQLVHVRRFLGYATGPDETFELVYDGKEKPQKLISQYGPTGTPRTTYFQYDDRERLVKRETEYDSDFVIFRYEYDNADNVAQVYYKDIAGVEILGRENLSFDKHHRFYASNKELEMFHIYILKYEPSKNNVLTAKVYYNTPQSKLSQPYALDYEVSYNEKGLVESSVAYSSPSLMYEYTFFDVNYNCW